MVDSTKELCPLFNETEIWIPSDSPSIQASLDKMLNFNSSQKRRNVTLLKQFIKLEWMRKGVMSIHSSRGPSSVVTV